MALLFLLSSRADLDGVPTDWDKGLHAGAYFVLGVLALRACHGGLRRLGPRATVAALVITLTYAALDELHQARVPGRHASVLDWVADAVGAATAVAVVGVLGMMLSRRERPGSIRLRKGRGGV
jgi:VanZ family protein